MLCQHFPEIVIDAVQIGSEITGNVTVPVVQMQQALKVFFALGAKQRYRQGGVPQFHIKKANTCDLKCGVIQINYIAWTVGRGKRIMGRKVRRAGELRDGIPLAGDRMAGQVGDLRLLLGLGEDGVGLVMISRWRRLRKPDISKYSRIKSVSRMASAARVTAACPSITAVSRSEFWQAF